MELGFGFTQQNLYSAKNKAEIKRKSSTAVIISVGVDPNWFQGLEVGPTIEPPGV